MLRSVLPRLACVLAIGPVAAQAVAHPDELKMKPEVDAAIAKGVEWLITEQFRDGSWGMHGDYVGGRAGLVLYALLMCGGPWPTSTRSNPTAPTRRPACSWRSTRCAKAARTASRP